VRKKERWAAPRKWLNRSGTGAANTLCCFVFFFLEEGKSEGKKEKKDRKKSSGVFADVTGSGIDIRCGAL